MVTRRVKCATRIRAENDSSFVEVFCCEFFGFLMLAIAIFDFFDIESCFFFIEFLVLRKLHPADSARGLYRQ